MSILLSQIDNRSTVSGGLNVWDTQYFPLQEAFAAYREALCDVFMPWSAEIRPDVEFNARIEAMCFEDSLISRVQLKGPLEVSRSKTEIDNSQSECFFVCYVLSGALTIAQAEQTNTARPGDLAVFTSSEPVRLQSYGGYNDLTFRIARESLSDIRDRDTKFQNLVVAAKQMSPPLLACLSAMAERSSWSSEGALKSLFDASVALIPLQTGCFGETQEILGTRSNCLFRDMQKFIEQNLDDGRLSPQDAADQHSVSVRYLHKIFAANGTTFNSLLMARRLERVCNDLLSPSCRSQPIASIAFRWGFNDLSTFTRAFKKRYLCSPRDYRRR